MKVPSYENSVRPRGASMAPVRGQAPTGESKLYDTIGDIAVFASKEYQKANLADAQNAMLELSDYANTAYSDPKTGVITKQQRNALGVTDSHIGRIDARRQEIASKLNNDHARKLFDEQYAPFKIQQQRQVMLYETGQIKAYENNVAEGTLTNLSNNLAKAQGDNALIMSYTNDIKKQIDTMSDTNGWSDEYKQAMVQKYVYSANLRNAENEVAQNYVNFQLQNGEPSDVKGSIRVAGNINDPRGIRNNNPGNIAKSANNWQGQSGDDGTYVKFATPEHGIRALSKNLLSYQRQGFDTVDSIVSRWAPDGNEQNYAKFVSEKLVVKSGDKIDLNNINTLNKFTSAIIEFENGKMPYSTTQMNQGVSSALGLFELSTPDKSTSTPGGNIYASPVSRLTQSVAFSTLEPSDQARLLKQAHTLENASNAQFRTELDQKVKDYTAAYMVGISYPNPPPESEFIRAYGAYESKNKYAEFSEYQVLASDISVLKNLPASAQNALVSMNEPDQIEGFAQKSEINKKRSEIVSKMQKEREIDPGGWLIKYDDTAKNAYQQYEAGQISGDKLAGILSAEHSKLEIKNTNIFPDSFIDGVINKIDTGSSSVSDIQQTFSGFGSYSESLVKQLQKKAGSALEVLTYTGNPRAANTIWQNRETTTEALKALVSKDNVTAIDKDWNDAVSGLAVTLTSQVGGGKILNSLNEQGKRLAYLYASKGMSNSAAAEQAYNDIIGSQYTIVDNWRLPNNLNLNPSDVRNGALHYLNTLSADKVSADNFWFDPLLPTDFKSEQVASRIKREGYWITSEDESGLVLLIGNQAVINTDGEPVKISFDELSLAGREQKDKIISDMYNESGLGFLNSDKTLGKVIGGGIDSVWDARAKDITDAMNNGVTNPEAYN